jgi:DNA polymerase-3 subunit delta
MIVTLTGSNRFLLSAELQQRTTDFVATHGDFALERLDGEEVSYNRIAEAVQSLPFLATNKLVILKNPSVLKEFQEKFEALVPTIADGTDVVIVETKLDKRTVYYKALKKLTDFKELNELDESQLASWLVTEAAAQELKLSKSDAAYLVERVGANQQLLSQELTKLGLYDAAITRKTIDLLTEKTPQSTIFELLDAAFQGRHKYAAQLYQEQRALKVEPQQILAMMAWQLHVLAVIKAAGQRDAGDIAREARVNPFVVRKTQSLARQLTLEQVRSLVSRTLELDVQMKSQSIDADEALQHLLLTLK